MDKKLLEKLGFRQSAGGGLGVRMEMKGGRLDADSGRNRIVKAALDRSSTFRPVSREEVEPKEGDYIYPTYRALSQAVVQLVDYRRPGVLEASAPMLAGQTVYPNHKYDVESWIGAVESAWWDDPEKTGTPFSLPGINARFKVDWRANPKIARGILMDPPALHSVSVTVWFKWEKSHPELDDRQFWTMLGQEVNGRPVLIEATEILEYDEISLVYQGGDPEAKILLTGTDGEEEQQETGQKNILSRKQSKPGGEQMEEKLKELMEKLKAETPEAALDQALALADQPPPDERVAAIAEALEKHGVEPAEAGQLISVGGRYRDKLREELKTFAALAMCEGDEKLPEGFVESHAGGDIGRLEAAVNVYRKMAEKKYPMVCQKCGSRDISSRSSARPDLREEAEKASRSGAPKVDTSRVHG